MKIRQKLLAGYAAIALVMGISGYLSLNIYNYIKQKVVELKKDDLGMLRDTNDLMNTLKRSQELIRTLIENRPRIIYTKTYTSSEIRKSINSRQHIEKQVQKDLKRIENITSSFASILSERSMLTTTVNEHKSVLVLRKWLDLRKKHLYYHMFYLSHFLHMVDDKPEQAYRFFESILDPHYRKNVFPIIYKYQEGESERKNVQINKIIDKYIPNATLIIICSTLLALFAVFALGFFIYNSVSGPLVQLTNAAESVGRGRLNTRIPIRSRDEVGILANSFNRMANKLSHTTVSKSYVDNIIKSMLDMMIVVDTDGSICKVNSSALNIMGYTQTELLSKKIDQIISGTEPSTIIDKLHDKGSIANIETNFLSKKNKHIPVLFSGAIMNDEYGEVQGYVCVARDIIERKRVELELQKAYDNLEKRVDERTGELLTSNKRLKLEIAQRKRTEDALRHSKMRLRQLSSHILSAREKERKKISMELHDDLGQSLSLLKMQIYAVQDSLNLDKTDSLSTIDKSLKYLDYIIENVRRLSRDLSPSVLEDLGLTAALQWLIDECTKHYKIKATIEIENIDTFFSSEDQITIYRIFQEILTNVGKHANASLVNMIIKHIGNYILFSVRDNGRGFNLKLISNKPSTEKGLGLAAMQERALMLHSNLKINSRIKFGTKIEFKIPIKVRK